MTDPIYGTQKYKWFVFYKYETCGASKGFYNNILITLSLNHPFTSKY